jgi:hypothetical protein
MEASNFSSVAIVAIVALAAIGFVVLACLVLRKFFCWYFKIDEILQKQDTVIELLKVTAKTDHN